MNDVRVNNLKTEFSFLGELSLQVRQLHSKKQHQFHFHLSLSAFRYVSAIT